MSVDGPWCSKEAHSACLPSWHQPPCLLLACWLAAAQPTGPGLQDAGWTTAVNTCRVQLPMPKSSCTAHCRLTASLRTWKRCTKWHQEGRPSIGQAPSWGQGATTCALMLLLLLPLLPALPGSVAAPRPTAACCSRAAASSS